MRFIPIVMATMVDDSVHRVEQKLPNKKNKERIELHHSFEQSLSEYSICFTIAFYLALHMAKNKHRYMNSLRSRRYLGGGMRRREKESEEKWEGRERNSACRKAICFLISAQVPPIKKQPISD